MNSPHSFWHRTSRSGLNRFFLVVLLIINSLLHTVCAATQHESPIDRPLPTLGDSSSGLVSLQQERALGQAWLRALRGKVQTFHDPLVEDYFVSLVYRLAANSELSIKRLELVIIDNPDLNAFAVPGGIIGINTGLFVHATNEQEFASVLAHELAHLSQRHFARRIEQSRQELPLQLAAILASIVVSATAGGDKGLAVYAATQAASIQSQLSYSRQNEQEADRIGIQTLYLAGMNPRAMPSMFGEMLKLTQFQGDQPPEYLLTHPVTESRIADSRNRAEQFPAKGYEDDLEYHLIRTRILAHTKRNDPSAIDFFTNALTQRSTTNNAAERYGLALAYLQNNMIKEGSHLLQTLTRDYPTRITFHVSMGQALYAEGKTQEAIAYLEQQLTLNPNNYPLLWILSELYMKQEQFRDAAQHLQQLTYSQASNPAIWQRHAEVYGKLNEAVRSHQSLAEYHLLIGDIDKALIHLQQAQRKSKSEVQTAIIQKRMNDLFALKKLRFQ